MRLLLDANILYPSTLRDLFLTLAIQEKFELFWSERIIQEWLRSIKPTLKAGQKNALEEIVKELKVKFPNAWVTNFEGSIDASRLKDKDDVHVVESAISAQVDYLVTFNTRDFPNSILKKYNIRVVHPDRFLSDRMLANDQEIIIAINAMCTNPRYQKFSLEDILELLKNRGLLRTARMANNQTKTSDR